MTAMEAERVRAVVNQVRDWPAELRLTLASEIVQTVRPESPETARRAVSGADFLGLFANDRPAPTDEECRRILEDELIRKYA